MTMKRVSWVGADLFETMVQGKLTYYVNVAFDDGDTASIGKQDHDKALEIRGLLTELQGKATEFILEDKGEKNSKGGDKYKIKAFGDMAQPSPSAQGKSNATVGYTPQHSNDEAMRHGVAMKAAAIFAQGKSYTELGEAFAFIDRLLLDAKTSEPASSAYAEMQAMTLTSPEGGGTDTVLPVGSPVVQAGAGSETTSPGAEAHVTDVAVSAGDTQSAVSAADGGAGPLGKESCPPPRS